MMLQKRLQPRLGVHQMCTGRENGLHKIYIVYYRQISVATKGLHKSAWFLCNTRFPLVVHKDEGIKTAI